MKSACMIGWSHSPFGRLGSQTLESLITDAAQAAIQDAGVDFQQIDEIFVGNFNSGMDTQGFPASLALNTDPSLRFKPATRVENACASGSAALYAGLRAISSGAARIVLVIGAEKMTAATPEIIKLSLLSASYVAEESDAGSFAGLFGQITESYFRRYGDKSEALARIAAKNHANGSQNELAHIRKDLGFHFCNEISDRNPLVAGPLRRTDCSMVSDGAAAVVLAASDIALRAPRAVAFRSAVQVNDFLPMSKRDMTFLSGCENAWQKALRSAGATLHDLSFLETHDCFTIAELMEYEAMGLTRPGEGEIAINEGWTTPQGKLPVNVSGGLKAKGHPIGATGVSMHVIAAMQLTGRAAGIQLPNSTLAGVFNMGGAGVANYVSIMERKR